MSNYRNIVSDVISADRLLSSEPCLLWGAVILCSVAGGDATIYDGHDAVSGKPVLPLKAGANASIPVPLVQPIFCGQGLYVDIGSNVTSLTVIWEAVPKEE